MSETFDTLSGFWTGVYDYSGVDAPVPFNAVLTEGAGALTGESIEPNTFADPGLSELFASFNGMREAEHVTMVKSYEAAPGAGHSLHYDGVVDEALTRIEGRWRAMGPLAWSGHFVMNRNLEAAGEALPEVATVELGEDSRR